MSQRKTLKLSHPNSDVTFSDDVRDLVFPLAVSEIEEDATSLVFVTYFEAANIVLFVKAMSGHEVTVEVVDAA